MPPIDALRRLITEVGYRVAYRPGPWAECLVSRDAERWLGRGLTEDAAFDNALRQMLPSALARSIASRALLVPKAERLPEARAVWAAPEPQTGLEDPHARAPAASTYPVVEACSVGQFANTPTAVVAPEPPAPVAAPVPTAPPDASLAAPERAAAPATVAPAPPRLAEQTTTSVLVGPAPLPERRPIGVLSPAPRDVLESLQRLAARIEAELPRFARKAAERQRLTLLVWICEAREAEEQLPDNREVGQLVRRVAHRLGELAKLFWPGTVRALQLATRPADALELRSGGTLPPRSWREGSHRARGKLEEHVASTGLDEDGWADAAAREPPAPDPDAVLAEGTAALNRHLGANDDAELAVVSADELLRVARTLRWVRARVRDHVAWGLAIGRIRRVLPGLGDRGARVKEALDPRFRPLVPWATLLGGRAAELPAGPSAKEALTEKLAATSRTPEALLAWLIQAIEAFSSPELADVLAPVRDQVLAIGEAGSAHEDRRVRRRFRDLVERLSARPIEPITAATHQSPADAPDETLVDLERTQELDRLVAVVRPNTEGKRVLFVSNRHDADLEAKLTELLGVKITECDGTIRRVQAQCARIANGSYDLVLSATGFQVHGVDGALSRTAGAAHVPYVRVNRGRPLACLQAIARELGLAADAGGSGGAAAVG